MLFQLIISDHFALRYAISSLMLIMPTLLFFSAILLLPPRFMSPMPRARFFFHFAATIDTVELRSLRRAAPRHAA